MTRAQLAPLAPLSRQLLRHDGDLPRAYGNLTTARKVRANKVRQRLRGHYPLRLIGIVDEKARVEHSPYEHPVPGVSFRGGSPPQPVGFPFARTECPCLSLLVIQLKSAPGPWISPLRPRASAMARIPGPFVPLSSVRPMVRRRRMSWASSISPLTSLRWRAMDATLAGAQLTSPPTYPCSNPAGRSCETWGGGFLRQSSVPSEATGDLGLMRQPSSAATRLTLTGGNAAVRMPSLVGFRRSRVVSRTRGQGSLILGDQDALHRYANVTVFRKSRSGCPSGTRRMSRPAATEMAASFASL
jgi:hypothetical protein